MGKKYLQMKERGSAEEEKTEGGHGMKRGKGYVGGNGRGRKKVGGTRK